MILAYVLLLKEMPGASKIVFGVSIRPTLIKAERNP